MIKKIYTHFKTITKHKLLVGKYCFKLGMYKQCIMHDMSKYSPTEFIECVKYANGVRSPISISREINGYSKAWLHHKGRNKHHFEYWIETNGVPSVIPFEYCMESVIDIMSASINYTTQANKEWNEQMLIDYWDKDKDGEKSRNMDNRCKMFFRKSFEYINEIGIEKAFKNRKHFEDLYKESVGE